MRSSPSPLSYDAACRQIGVTSEASFAVARSAFRTAIKAARPDQSGGDAELFRQIIEAWAIIQAVHAERSERQASRPPPRAFVPPEPAPLIVVISPLQAVTGARIEVARPGTPLRLTLPPGVRSAEVVTFPGAGDDGTDLKAPVLIRPGEGLSVLGDDLYMDWAVHPRLLEDGGRIEVETWAGPRQAWVAPALTSPARLRLKGLGLPARGERPCGHLLVTLVPSQDAPTAAELLRDRFCREWTPERASHHA